MDVARLVSRILDLLFPNQFPKIRVTDVIVYVSVIMQILIEIQRDPQENG